MGVVPVRDAAVVVTVAVRPAKAVQTAHLTAVVLAVLLHARVAALAAPEAAVQDRPEERAKTIARQVARVPALLVPAALVDAWEVVVPVAPALELAWAAEDALDAADVLLDAAGVVVPVREIAALPAAAVPVVAGAALVALRLAGDAQVLVQEAVTGVDRAARPVLLTVRLPAELLA